MRQGNHKQEIVKSNHKLIGTLVILATLTALILPATIAYVSNSSSDNDLATSNDSSSQLYADQAKCLNDAYSSYGNNWKNADQDGDKKVSFSDGATDITTAYYDNAISCYRAYKTVDSNSYITDYQMKRQQEIDKYTAWIESSKQPTYVPSYNNDYRSSINCSSNSIGTSVYTTCR